MDIRAEVFRALSTAIKENGYSFGDMTSREIAEDLITYDSTLEESEIDEVKVFVEEWQKENA